jgi:hypothetical protein
MVAYSFKARFAAPIISGAKRQTIRAHRNRHARPGEPLQLYTGMRTKQCRKLLAVDPICTVVSPISLWFDRSSASLHCEIRVAGRKLNLESRIRLARADGFSTLDEMAAFWFEEHGFNGQKAIYFTGVLIEWEPGVERA